MKPLRSGQRFFLDMLPLGAFFIGYQLGDLMLATALIMVATVISLGVTYAVERRIATSPLVSGILVGVFGGLTLALNDELFIKMKPTIINCLFASVLLGGVYIFKKGLLKKLLEVAFTISDAGWLKLSARWGFFFLFLAILNEVIWRNFSTDFWVNFKVFGMMSCTIIFSIAQLPLIKKYAVNVSDNAS
ncbi:MAG: septation protein A [Rickettsiales bacterium]|nr:septation protein A [Rickettsiales bacterium]